MQVSSGLPAILRIFCQAYFHDSFERRRRDSYQRRQWWWFVTEDRGYETGLTLTLKCFLARDHFKEHRTECEDVRSRIGLLAIQLLGSHVLKGPENHPLGRQTCGLRGNSVNRCKLRQTEI